MLINSLNFNQNTPSSEDIQNLLTGTLDEISLLLLINYLNSEKNYAKHYQTIIRNPNLPLNDNTLARIIKILHKTNKQYGNTQTPAYTELLTEILNHPLSGNRTLKAYYDVCEQSVNLWSTNPNPEHNLINYIALKTTPTERSRQLTEQQYTKADITAHIALAYTLQNNPDEATNLTLKAFKQLPDSITPTQHRLRKTSQLHSLNKNLKLAIKTINTNRADYTENINEPLLNIKAFTLILHTIMQQNSIFAFEKQRAPRTATQIAETIDLTDEDTISFLSNSPALPQEYSEKLVKLQLEEIIEKEYINKP